MRVLHVCSELYPFLKTGGLADVTDALPVALKALDCEVRVLVPGFPSFMNGIKEKKLVYEFQNNFGAHSTKLVRGIIPESNITIYIIDAPEFYDRPGNPYADLNGEAYPDNYKRFGLLGWVAAQIATSVDVEWQPEIIHAHDWHAGLAPAYIKAEELTHGKKLARSVFTIHNLAYQGLFPAVTFYKLNLPDNFYTLDGLEFFNQVSFMKAGLAYADKITTVSPSYAKEIQLEENGCGLQGLLAHRRDDLVGILNGVDARVWNPAHDSNIAANYSAKSLTGKQICKAELQKSTGIEIQSEKPLFVIISRLTEQKGLNLVLSGLPEILDRGGQIVILGAGDKDMEKAYTALAKKHKKQMAVKIGYDEQMAHALVAGGDVILVPSRFEPCGLTQLYGLSYGTLPLARRVGGLKDTVNDSSLENLVDETATGFVFHDFSVEEYTAAIRRAFALYSRKSDWKKVQKRGMKNNFGWENSAKKYLNLYQQIIS